MKLTGWKKQCVIVSVICIIAGMLIGGIGYGLTGFSADEYLNHDRSPWYWTIYFGK